MRWVLQHKTSIAIGLGIILLIVAGIWFWGVLVGYVHPGTKGATDRKDVVQAFALIVAGVVGFIGAIVGVANLSVSRRNLQQQIDLEESRRRSTLELETQRSQDASLQAYFEQMGDLLTNHNLISTDREDVRRLAEAQTLTVLASLDGPRKRSLIRFLHGAVLINKDKPIMEISGADLRHADLSHADVSDTDLSDTDLSKANLYGTNLSAANLKDVDLNSAWLVTAILREADLSHADLRNATLSFTDLSWANLSHANLSNASLSNVSLSNANLRAADLRGARGWTEEQIAAAESLEGATMPDGSIHD